MNSTVAEQAHYTSAPPGAAGRQGGFRFTAASPGARRALDALRPLLAYAPPPGAPPRPGPGELAAFPRAFAYDVLPLGEGGAAAPALTLTRYLGQDYTGRWGNHFGHAVLASPGELAGLRPIELWKAPLWARDPAPDDGDALPVLGELAPGTAVGPHRVRRLLEETGEEGARLLEHLLAAVLGALEKDCAVTVTDSVSRPSARPVVLVSDSTERMVDWLAAVSYALPAPLAERLTFTTYTDRPREDHRHLAGTVPAVWERGGAQQRPAFDLDRLDRPAAARVPAAGEGPCRAARLLARAWARDDLDTVDAVAELWSADPGGEAVARLRAACALVAACGWEGEPVQGPEREALEALLDRFAEHGLPLPEAVQEALAAGRDWVDAPLAARLLPVAPRYRDAARHVLERALLDGKLDGVEERGPSGAEASPLARFAHALVRLRPDAAGVPAERVREAAEQWLADRPAPFGDDALAALLPAADPHACPDRLPAPYRRAVLAGVLAALEADEELRGVALTPSACVLLADPGLDPLGAGEEGEAGEEEAAEGAEPLAVAPRTALRVLSLGTADAAPPVRRSAALRVLRLYRRGLLEEADAYDAVSALSLPAARSVADVADVADASAMTDAADGDGPPRRPWRRLRRRGPAAQDGG